MYGYNRYNSFHSAYQYVAERASMRYRSSRALLIVFIAVMATSVSCSESPTAPTFPYTGIWTGFWKDYLSSNTGVPAGSALSMNIGDDGIAFASGQFTETYLNGTLNSRISMTFTVFPDGSLSGTGVWSFTFPGLGRGGEGEVIGQLDKETDTGSGALHVEIEGVIFHFPWRVEREK